MNLIHIYLKGNKNTTRVNNNKKTIYTNVSIFCYNITKKYLQTLKAKYNN